MVYPRLGGGQGIRKVLGWRERRLLMRENGANRESVCGREACTDCLRLYPLKARERRKRRRLLMRGGRMVMIQ